ncbi:hypothetical protein EB061_07990, partial [bacterium]|nr:hypothetical protein [bacterium]
MRPFKWGKSVLVLVAILTAASTFAAAVDTSSGSGTSEPSSPDPVVDPVIDSGSDPLADPVKGGDPSLSGDPNVSIDPSVKAISNTTGGTIKDPGVDQGSASIFGGIFDGWLVTYGSRLTFEDGTIVENTGRSSPNIINTGSICMDQNPSSNLIFQFGCHADDQYGTYSPGGHTAGTDDTNFTSAHYGYDTYASHGFPDSAHHSTAWRNCKKAILRTWTCGPGCTGGFTGGSDIQDTACYYYVQAPNPPKVFDISAGDLSDAAIKDSGIGPFALSGPPETPTMNPTASAFWVMLDWPSLKLQLQGLIPYPAVYPHDNPATVGFEYGIGTASFGITGSTIITSHPFTPIGYGLSWIYETIGGSTSYPVSCGVNYAVRAYAQNSSGTSYSNWVDLTVPCPAPIVIMDPTTPRIQLSLTGSSGSLTNLNMFKGKLISAGITSSSGASSTVVGLGFEYCDTSASGCSASSMPSSASVIYSGAFPGSAFTGGYTSFSTGSFDSIGWGYYTGSGTAGATALTCGHSYYVRAKASNGTTAYSVAYSPIVSVSVACPSAPHITTNSYSGSAIVASPSASSVTVTAAMDFASGGAAPTPAPVSNVTLEYGNATTSSSTSTWISGTVGSVSIPATAIVVPASCSTSASSYTLSSSYPIPPTAVPCIQASASLPIPACSGVAQTVYYQFKSTDNLTQTTLGGIQSVSVPACVSPVLSLSSAGATYSFSSSALTATFQTGTLTSLGSFPFSGLTFRFSYEDAGSATTGTTSAPGGTAGAAVASVTGSGAGATFAASSTWAGLCGKRFYYWPSVSYGSSTWFGYDSSGRSGLILMPPCITTT